MIGSNDMLRYAHNNRRHRDWAYHEYPNPDYYRYGPPPP